MIYYYCTNATFLSIVKHRSLWLSDMTQSNDSYEIHRYVEIVANALKSEAEHIEASEKAVYLFADRLAEEFFIVTDSYTHNPHPISV